MTSMKSLTASRPSHGSGSKALAILGATGSVGKSTLDVVAAHPDRFKVHALTAHRSAQSLLDLCMKHQPAVAVLSGCAEDATISQMFRRAGCKAELLFGPENLLHAVNDCDAVMAAIVGAAGLAPTLRAAEKGKQILLANKEALVMAGPVFMQTVRQSSACLLPIDSEHNAVFQCLPAGRDGRTELGSVSRIVLTASGGPFRKLPADQFRDVTPEAACAHPNWDMGRKISVDSATMMNKGLEVIEARWLFDLPPSRIEVLIHPQSIVHSMVEYIDGSVLAQLSNPDMRIPIAHALAFPDRIASGVRSLDLAEVGQLQFESPDLARFPCLGLAYQALEAGGTAPAILNASNEVAVQAFLEGQLRFPDIATVIAETLERVCVRSIQDLSCVLEADGLARVEASRLAREIGGRQA